MTNKFCKLLSNGYKIELQNNQLMWSPCCFYSKKTPLLDKIAFDKTLTYTDGATSWLPECNTCRKMELTGVESLMPRKTNPLSGIDEEFNKGDCVALELSFDTKCNAACLSCGPYASTTWDKYEHKRLNYSFKKIDTNVDSTLQKLIDNVPMDKIRHIFAMGGEPFYSDSNLKLLKHLKNVHPALNMVKISYQTNGSIYPSDEVLEMWKDLKSVTINLSIDGTGNRFDYLRYPLKWHRVTANVQRLLDNTNVKFNFNCTVGPLNILYFNEVEDWALKIIPEQRRVFTTGIRPNRCCWPMDLSLAHPDLRQHIVNTYGADHKLSKMLSCLEVNTDYESMFSYIERHDQHRRLSWRKTFPDIAQFYKK